MKKQITIKHITQLILVALIAVSAVGCASSGGTGGRSFLQNKVKVTSTEGDLFFADNGEAYTEMLNQYGNKEVVGLTGITKEQAIAAFGPEPVRGAKASAGKMAGAGLGIIGGLVGANNLGAAEGAAIGAGIFAAGAGADEIHKRVKNGQGGTGSGYYLAGSDHQWYLVNNWKVTRIPGAPPAVQQQVSAAQQTAPAPAVQAPAPAPVAAPAPVSTPVAQAPASGQRVVRAYNEATGEHEYVILKD